MFSCYFVGRRPTGILRGRFYWIWHWSPRYTCFRAAGGLCVCYPLGPRSIVMVRELSIYIYGRGSTGVGLVGGGVAGGL